MNQTALLRYNFRILMLNNWMLLVFPIAVSQLTVFWFVLTHRFSQDLPAQSVEMITPLLAAFLGAHLLSAEYRSRVGAVLASRPVNISRIVVLRLLVMLTLVGALAGLSLTAYNFWMDHNYETFELMPPVLACIPSTLFLTMLALTFATVFRHSLAGFGVAALYWAMDLVPGAPIQPYLSLHSLTTYYVVSGTPYFQTFVLDWWVSKILLLIAAIALYLCHTRLVFTLGSPPTMRIRRRASLAIAGILVFYLLSGAVMRVGYGYTHRGHLPDNDLAWFRYQFASFGPIPVAPLFGPAFNRYLGEIVNPWRTSSVEEADQMGDTVKHKRELQEILQKMPDSIWAPAASDAFSRLEARHHTKVEEAISYYQYTIDRFPNSPFQDYALKAIAHTYADAERPEDAHRTYEELLKRSPGSVYRSEAFRFLTEFYQKAGHLPEAAHWAEQWTTAAPVQEKFEAWMYLAEIRQAQGDPAGAKKAGQSMVSAVREFQQAVATHRVALSPAQKNLREVAVNRATQLAKTLQIFSPGN